ncbi:hypothetical protein ACHAQA_002161 [Verticillium albo-atrum]
MADPHVYQGDPGLNNTEALIQHLQTSLNSEQSYLDGLPQDARYGYSAHQVNAAERKCRSLRDQLKVAKEKKKEILQLAQQEHVARQEQFAQQEQLARQEQFAQQEQCARQEQFAQQHALPNRPRQSESPLYDPVSMASSGLMRDGYPTASKRTLSNAGDSLSPTNPNRSKRTLSNAGDSLSLTNPSRSKRTLSNAGDSLSLTSPGRSKRPAFGISRRSSTSSSSSVMDLTVTDDKIEAAIAKKRSKTDERRRQDSDNPLAGLPSFLQERINRTEPEPAPAQPAPPTTRTAPTWPPPFNLNSAQDRNNARQQGQQQRPQPASGLAATIQRTNGMDFTAMTDVDGNPLDEHMQANLQRIMGDSPPRASKKPDPDEERNRRQIEKFVRTAGADIPNDELEQTPQGMRYPLYPHQKQALTWMKKQEAGRNKGGILGDDMGLGKTISTLALMIANPGRNACRTNLIVAPLSLIGQWEDEIKNKMLSGYQLSVCVFHDNNRPTAAEMMRFDVVLTTYNTMYNEHKKVKTFWEKAVDRNIDQDNDPDLARSLKLFHPRKSMFYRIILDEAQGIKNRKGKISEAAPALMAKYRWCLTGTPMMNSLHETFALYRFLHIAPYNEWTNFNEMFGELKERAEPGPALNTFRVLLQKTMLRRDKNSKINGQRILQLPDKTEEIIHIDLEGEQLEYYKAVTENAKVMFNAYIRKGSSNKQYTVLLVQLLRMRQAVCHPHLVLDEEEEGDDAANMELAQTLEPKVVARLMEQVSNGVESLEGFDCPVCLDKITNPVIPFPCGHYLCPDCLQAHVENCERDNIRHGENARLTRCAVCRDPLDRDKAINLSTFKKVHMPEFVEDEEADEENGDQGTTESDSDDSSGEDDSDDEESSSNGNKEDTDGVDGQGNLRGFVVVDDSSDIETPSKRPQKKNKGKGKLPSKKKSKKRMQTGPKRKIKATMLKSLRKSAKRSARDNRDYHRYLSKHWMSSAKVDACMDLIKRIRDESGGEAKTLIFSQWTMFLDLVEIALSKDEELKNVDHVRYDGEMKMKNRTQAAKKFRETPETKLMLLSLKAGNAGLNLVQASRVIILDPFWNPYIEMQAVDRVHRIGQQSDVKVYRILVKDSVEDRIMEIQDNKRNAISSALDGKSSSGMGLNFADLRHLFGF